MYIIGVLTYYIISQNAAKLRNIVDNVKVTAQQMRLMFTIFSFLATNGRRILQIRNNHHYKLIYELGESVSHLWALKLAFCVEKCGK